MVTLFWASVAIVAYVYAGYPALLGLWSSVAARPIRKQRSLPGVVYPPVSIIVAARNEAARLPARIRNLLDQDYPGPVEIIVVSDGSTDGTPAALERFRAAVRLIELPQGGKPRAVNAGAAAATGEILVFADARQRFALDAVRQLVANFADPTVGGVTGELMLDVEGDATVEASIGEGVGLYWKYEKWLRRHESRVGSTLGATGAIYALRRALWQPLPAEALLDDVLAPMRVVLAGHRMVFDDAAKAFDRAEPDSATESRRKTRTLAGNYQILSLEPRLLVPFANPVWGQYVSHKLGRLIVPWALIVALLTSAVLAPRSWVYAVALMLQLCLYGLAAFGMWAESRELSRTPRTPDPPPDHPSEPGDRLDPTPPCTDIKLKLELTLREFLR
ncbi:MAG: glycosyltransferase family 2 protein [Acidobacteria bacterium]|nr:glycosyltransferase family 2 protein [Acidobacteriota bacterium]